MLILVHLAATHAQIATVPCNVNNGVIPVTVNMRIYHCCWYRTPGSIIEIY